MIKLGKYEFSARKVFAFLAYILCIIFLGVFVSSRTDLTPSENTGTTATSGIQAFGYFPTIVVSGSMEPEMMTNSMSLIKVTTLDDIEVGDIVAFTFNNEMVTHRVIEKTTDNDEVPYLRTKGDANDFVDQIYVRDYMVRGKVVKTWNETAPVISKYLIAPGEVDSLAIAQTLIWIFVTIGIGTVILVWLWGYLGALIKLLLFKDYYKKSLVKLKSDSFKLDEHLNYLEELTFTDEEKTLKTKVFNTLARARAIREIEANTESLKDLNNAINQSKWLEKQGKK